MRKFAFLWLAMLPWCVYAQRDTSYKLDEFIVLSNKAKYGFKNPVDSTKLKLFNSKTLADLLASESGVFIKNYGIGGLSTLSIRGGSAEQTNIKWNGLSLNSPLNGVLDLNTIPVFIMGAKSNINASETGMDNAINAASGSVELSTSAIKNNGVSIFTSLNNVGNKALGLRLGIKNKLWKYKVNAFAKYNNNLYPFINPFNNSQQIELHANNRSIDLLQETITKWGRSTHIKIGNWLQHNNRQIANGLNPGTKQGYKNQHSYSFLHANKRVGKYKVGLELGHRFAKLNYTDTGNSIDGLHSFNEFSGKLKYKRIINNSIFKHFYTSSSFNYSLPKSNGFATSNIKRMLYNIEVGSKLKWKTINANVFVKQQWEISRYSFPQMSISLQKGEKKHKIMAKYATLYRLPTLNERFWGGENTHIKPEKGHIVEMAYEFIQKKINIKISPFYKKIGDYINWKFGNGKTQAQNTKNTQFYGTDFKINIVHPIKNMRLKSIITYNYINAKYLNNSELKYLIFVPKHQASYLFNAEIAKFSINFNTIYSDKVYTSNDNLSSLNGYIKSDLMLNYRIKIKSKTMNIGTTIFNVFNQNYATIPSNPNPLRHFLMSIEILL